MMSFASPVAPSSAPLSALLGLAACTAPVPDSSVAESEIGALITTAFQDGVAPTAGYAGTRDTLLEQHAGATNDSWLEIQSREDAKPGGRGWR